MTNPIHGRRFPQFLARMQTIHFPSHEIGGDVFPDAVQFRFVAYDVFPIITLPYDMNVGVGPQPSGHPDLKPPPPRAEVFGLSVLGQKIFPPPTTYRPDTYASSLIRIIRPPSPPPAV